MSYRVAPSNCEVAVLAEMSYRVAPSNCEVAVLVCPRPAGSWLPTATSGESEIRVIHRPLHPELDCNKVRVPRMGQGNGPRRLRGGGAQLLDCTALSSPLGCCKEYQSINVGIRPPSQCRSLCHCRSLPGHCSL